MRQRFVNVIAALNASTLVASIFVLGGQPERSLASSGDAPVRPNVVVFMTDDQTVEQMRFLKRTNELLVDRGVSFANSFVTFPLCCPARATYLTGQYPHNHGVLFNDPPFGYPVFRGKERLPAILRGEGYRTIHVGKYMNEYGVEDPTEIPTGWSRFHAAVGPSAHWYHGYTMNHNGTLKTYGEVTDPDPATYHTDVMRQVALDEIDEAVADGVPFFLSMSFLAPHGEVGYPGQDRVANNPRAAPRHDHLYRDAPMPIAPSFNERDLNDKPAAVQQLKELSPRKREVLQLLYRARARSLKSVDQAVARVVVRLERAGLLDETYFVFTSDNGFFTGEHRLRYGKYLPYEPSIRVPLIVAGPGIPAGTESRQLVSNVDLAPTVLELASLPVPADEMDGRSLVPYLRAPGRTDARILLFESAPAPGSGIDLTSLYETIADERAVTQLYQAVRTDRFKYIEYHDGTIELYDLARDPDERSSVHHWPGYAQVRRMLRAALELLRECRGDDCRTAERHSLVTVSG